VISLISGLSRLPFCNQLAPNPDYWVRNEKEDEKRELAKSATFFSFKR
jgi:hypothetical protein